MFGDSHKTDQNQTDDEVNTNGTAPGLGLGSRPDPVDDSTSNQTPDLSSAPVAQPILPQDDPIDQNPVDDPSTPGPEATDDLGKIKQQALDQLSPLVHKLDQSPEEKYKTLIMMVQASDNKDLLSEAYQAAQNISDEKAKAEALLTIVNEINYFTQK
jgi:hypothetical protein